MTRRLRLQGAAAAALLALASLPAWAQPATPQPPGWASAALLTEIVSGDGAGQPAPAARCAAWRRQLLQAEAAGDPLASWVLRHCPSTLALDRTGLDSSCSQAPDARQRAAERLLALDLGPSFNRAARAGLPRAVQMDGVCTDPVSGWCTADATARWLAQRLADAERDGVVQGLDNGQLARCPPPAVRNTPTEADARCLGLRHHLQAMHTLARQHLLLAWAPAAQEAGRVTQHPYARMEGPADVPMRNGGDTTWNADDEATERFYEGVLRSLQTMNQNLQLRLLKEPRWAAFIGRVPLGLERSQLPRETAPPAGKDGPSLAHKHRQQALRLVGRYTGAGHGTSSQPVHTWLHPSDLGVVGGYAFLRGSGDDLKLNLGRLGPCLVGEPSELVCVWRDRFGTGLVSMLFNDTATEFRARWDRLHARPTDFMRMDPRHWDGPTPWNGLLQ